MTDVALWVVGLSLALLLYTYAGYPLLLWLVGRFRPEAARADVSEGEWPLVVRSAEAAGFVVQALDAEEEWRSGWFQAPSM